MLRGTSQLKPKIECYHCGNECSTQVIQIEEKNFCCQGCKTVFQILDQNNLCEYYKLSESPGIQQAVSLRADKFNFLDDEQNALQLFAYRDNKQAQVHLFLPQIHCSSCLWLLENLSTLNNGIIISTVNFERKEVFIAFDINKTNLKDIVLLLAKIGYEPQLNLQDIHKNKVSQLDRHRWYKMGVAGFCFGNIMMLSLAHYTVDGTSIEPQLALAFSTISLILSIPVLFYCASEFFVASWHSIKSKYASIDLPIAIALLITFGRSLYEIAYFQGNGYLDSMSGIVFFMLVGRWLQSRTLESISFDRDYKSFLPISIDVVKNESSKQSVPLTKLQKSDKIIVYNNEIIPVDGILSKGNALIDYSFVTGESIGVPVKIGEIIYSGGKVLGDELEIVVTKEVDQSYLTKLWNNPIFNKKAKQINSQYDKISTYFTYIVLILGALASLYWLNHNRYDLMWNALTTILIVACPCALLLTQTYTNGNILRLFSKHNFYIRSADVIEKLQMITHIVLDKTGTLTNKESSQVQYFGRQLTLDVRRTIASLLASSNHPLNKIINTYLLHPKTKKVENYTVHIGNGIEGWVDNQHIKIGAPAFVGTKLNDVNGSTVCVWIDQEVIGTFIIQSKYREGIEQSVRKLGDRYKISLNSGDNASEKKKMESMLPEGSRIMFNCTPQMKMDYIQGLQISDEKVLMLGDGLNDAGALKQSDVGIAVADNCNVFTPASDAIIMASSLPILPKLLDFARLSKYIIYVTFSFSLIYNIVGLWFALQGKLTPIIAAVLMPLSSMTIIAISYASIYVLSKKLNLQKYLIT